MKRVMLCSMAIALGIFVPAYAGPQKETAAPTAEARLPQLKIEQLNDAQRKLADEILKVSGVGLGGPYNALLRSPEMGERMFQLLDYLRFNTSVPRRLNEFAILIQARVWSSQVEWYSHYPLAIKAGLAESVAQDLKQGKRPASMQPDEAAVYDFCMEMSSRNGVSDATFRRLRNIFTEQQVVDLAVVSGTYAGVAMLLDASAQGAPAGAKDTLQRLPAR